MRYFGKDIKLIVNNLEVSYTDNGADDAPVIIFIHGFPLNKSMWNKQIEAFKDTYRVIAYDIRGHGDSEGGDKGFSINLFTSDLISLMDILKIDKATLCGLSMGGYIALNAVENHPERFDALVLSDTHCMADPTSVIERRLSTIDSIKENGVEKYVDDSIKNLFAPESFITKKDVIASVRDMIINTCVQSLSKTLLALALRQTTCGKMPEITVPVLFIVGEEDQITPPEASELMHEKIKNSTLHIIEHAGHLSNMEEPEEYNEQLKKFFESVYKDPEINSDENITILEQLRTKLAMILAFRI